MVGLCAFDSHLNSPSGSWELQGAQLTVFHELLADPRTARFSGTPMVAGFTAAPLSGRVPLTVRFTDTSVGPVEAWSWSFGDGGTSTQRDPMHTYTAPGTYTVSLTVIDLDGATATSVAHIDVLPRPGDADGDGDVDMRDFGRLQVCLSPPGVSYLHPDCAAVDMDGDGDVDPHDLLLFLGCLSGANLPADPDCAD